MAQYNSVSAQLQPIHSNNPDVTNDTDIIAVSLLLEESSSLSCFSDCSQWFTIGNQNHYHYTLSLTGIVWDTPWPKQQSTGQGYLWSYSSYSLTLLTQHQLDCLSLSPLCQWWLVTQARNASVSLAHYSVQCRTTRHSGRNCLLYVQLEPRLQLSHIVFKSPITSDHLASHTGSHMTTWCMHEHDTKP